MNVEAMKIPREVAHWRQPSNVCSFLKHVVEQQKMPLGNHLRGAPGRGSVSSHGIMGSCTPYKTTSSIPRGCPETLILIILRVTVASPGALPPPGPSPVGYLPMGDC